MNPKPLFRQCCRQELKPTDLCGCWQVNRDVGNSTVKRDEGKPKVQKQRIIWRRGIPVYAQKDN